MDALSFPRASKMASSSRATKTQGEGDRDDGLLGLPLGTVDSFPGKVSKTARPSSQYKKENSKDQQEVVQPVDPYSQPFTIEAAFSLSIDEQFLPCYLQGYNLYQESRTSK